MAKIGIVSSIALPNNLLTALKSPLAAHNIAPPEDAKGDYDANSKRKMKKAVRQLLVTTAPNADLVIAVGGLVSARAVSDYMDDHDDKAVPFLICVGRAPNEGSSLWDNEQFMGGINLDTANQNSTRAALLKKKHPGIIQSVGDICLYYNKNSHMAVKEAKEWSFFGLLKESTVDHTANAANTAAQFKDDFASLPRGTKAVIVSSDPFFSSKAAELTDAATTKFPNGPVCFPNTSFRAATPPANFMFYGANLEAAYAALGQKAADLLALPKMKSLGLDTVLPEMVGGPPAPPFMSIDE